MHSRPAAAPQAFKNFDGLPITNGTVVRTDSGKSNARVEIRERSAISAAYFAERGSSMVGRPTCRRRRTGGVHREIKRSGRSESQGDREIRETTVFLIKISLISLISL
jgi:hypothetical protein